VKAALSSLAGATLLLAACGEAPTCTDETGVTAVSAATSGSAVLSLSGEAIRQRVRVTLRSLPQVWPTEPLLRDALLTTRLVEAFVDPGSTGLPMPHLAVAFGSEPPSGIPANASTPSTAPVVTESALFDCSQDPNGACCTYGVTECSFASTLFVTRVEGGSPPVTVDWQAKAKVTVGQCPLPSSPEIELTLEEGE
jgi:hypothetical protein